MFKFLILIFLMNESLVAIDAELDIVRKNSILPSINVVVTNNSFNKELSNKIKDTLEKDFEVSGNFNVLKNEVNHESIDAKFNFQIQGQINSNLVLFVEIQRDSKNEFIIHTLLEDSNSAIKKPKVSYSLSDLGRYPFLAHKIAIRVNKEANAPSIEWMDKFVIFSKYVGSKKSQIIIADYTLAYQKVIVSGGLNIFPKWANKEQTSFYYTSYDSLYPTLIKQNLYEKTAQKIVSSAGMVVCSDVSKDGSKLLLTMSPNGQADVYLYSLNEKQTKKLTNYSGIDVGANFLSSESSIVFVSDRLGKPNVFLLDLLNNSTERLVFEGSNNNQATTFNDQVVFSGRNDGSDFNLYLVSPKNNTLRQLTYEGLNQFPKFSSDGESLLFVKGQNGTSSIGIIRLNHNKTFLFPVKIGKLQSIDW